MVVVEHEQPLLRLVLQWFWRPSGLALVAVAVVSGGVQFHSDPGRIMMLLQALGQTYMFWCGLAVLAAVLKIVFNRHGARIRELSCCEPRPKATVSSRVCRGVVLPLILSACIYVLLRMASGPFEGSELSVWTYSLPGMFAFLPVWAEASQIYWSRESHDFLAAQHDILKAHKLRPVWFLRAYRWHAIAAMLLPLPFVHLSYMANEIGLFVDSLLRQSNAFDATR